MESIFSAVGRRGLRIIKADTKIDPIMTPFEVMSVDLSQAVCNCFVDDTEFLMGMITTWDEDRELIAGTQVTDEAGWYNLSAVIYPLDDVGEVIRFVVRGGHAVEGGWVRKLPKLGNEENSTLLADIIVGEAETLFGIDRKHWELLLIRLNNCYVHANKLKGLC